MWPLALAAALTENFNDPPRDADARQSPGVRGIRRAGPLTPEETDGRRQDWERVSAQASAELIGPTQLSLPASATREARLMSDVFYSRQRSTGKDLRYLLQGAGALFTCRAWWPG